MTGWAGPPLVGGRLVVVAPHPDDEVLGAGGLMRWTRAHGRPVVVVAVTDGEASHPRSSLVTPRQLRERRDQERADALHRLGVVATVVRLGVPDQGCARRCADIVGALTSLLEPGDIVVGPSDGDRHPDHVAVAFAVSEAAPAVVEQWWEAPTWASVHGTAAPPTSTLVLDDRAWSAKQHAVAAYRSQLLALGPDPDDGPVVRREELAAMLRRREEFAAVSERSRPPDRDRMRSDVTSDRTDERAASTAGATPRVRR